VGPSPQGGGPVPSPDWDEVLADIGDRIRAERQARRWSQTELGLRAGLSLNTVKRMENGNTTLRGFVAACAALQVSIGDLLAGEWQLPPVRPSLTAGQLRVLRAVARWGSASAAASRLGVPRDSVTSRLSEIYRRLGVTEVPRGEQRCSAAVRVAVEHGLLSPEIRTS
jgi:transcriptional regulator with XRE-family HTH domain